tara:strand:- start:132 stop:1076 length:945 start_codon:yes stop_codon:yes gene_type:complete
MQRVILTILAVFWLYMGFRLWQVEYAGKSLGSAVKIEPVWEKVLTALDEAPLSIVNEATGETLGWVNWAPMVTRDDETDPGNVDGMVEVIQGYTLSLERGRIFGDTRVDDLQFTATFGFAPFPTNNWTDVRISLKRQQERLNEQNFFEIAATEFRLDAQSTNDFLSLAIVRDEDEKGVDIKYEDLRNPSKLVEHSLELAQVNALVAHGINLATTRVLSQANVEKPLNFEIPLPKQAHMDVLPGVRAKVPVYRVEIPIVQDMMVKIYIYKTGEILRVEFPSALIAAINDSSQTRLPNELVLRNDNYYPNRKRKNP